MICLNDRVAFGAYQAAYGAGLRIPDQLSIVSFDDPDLAGWLRPELTSIAMPHDELGRRAGRLLLADDLGTRTILVPMPVRERESVGPPADRVASGGVRPPQSIRLPPSGLTVGSHPALSGTSQHRARGNIGTVVRCVALPWPSPPRCC